MFDNKSIFFIALVAIAVTGSIWATQIRSEAKPGALLFADNTDVVKTGQAIYSANCASCHGAELKGEANWRSLNAEGFMPAPPHNKSGHTWHHTDDVLFEITKYGLAKIAGQKDYKTNMPIYEGVLSDKEIIAALSYIKSTWPENIRERHDMMNEQKAKAKN
jgi:mono/diheme cytochrome c family protein